MKCESSEIGSLQCAWHSVYQTWTLEMMELRNVVHLLLIINNNDTTSEFIPSVSVNPFFIIFSVKFDLLNDIYDTMYLFYKFEFCFHFIFTHTAVTVMLLSL